MNATFYGEVLTTVYFIMQPIGSYAWLSTTMKPEESHFEAKKIICSWLAQVLGLDCHCLISGGLAYQSINSAALSVIVTDATNGVGHSDDTSYREQWIFWLQPPLVSTCSIHIQGMYWVYTLTV